MKIKKKFMASITGLGLLASAGAAKAVDTHGMMKVGIDFGGNNVFSIGTSTGDTDTIKANEGFYIGGGVALLNADKTITTEISLSWKYASRTATNGDATWTSYPLDALVFYNMQQVRFGGGLTYHLNPKLKATGVASNLSADYDNALGYVVEADYRLDRNMSLGVRLTSIKYSLENSANSPKVKGDGAGIAFSVNF